MGLIERVFTLVFGSGRNAVVETAGVFRENTEAGAEREAAHKAKVLDQFGQEFDQKQRGWFDRLMDAINRLPRPAMALGTLGLFIAAMTDPIWFAERMQGIALVPEPLWWLLGAIVSFYFGARHQIKGQDFQRSLTRTMARAPQVIENLNTLQGLRPDSPRMADTGGDAMLALHAVKPDGNAAVDDWRHQITQRPATK